MDINNLWFSLLLCYLIVGGWVGGGGDKKMFLGGMTENMLVVVGRGRFLDVSSVRARACVGWGITQMEKHTYTKY